MVLLIQLDAIGGLCADASRLIVDRQRHKVTRRHSQLHFPGFHPLKSLGFVRRLGASIDEEDDLADAFAGVKV